MSTLSAPTHHPLIPSLPRRGSRGGATLRLWWRSITVNPPQAVLAFLSLVVGAAVMSMLLNLYGGIERKITQEFRAYGANVVLAPGPSTSITRPHPLLPAPTEEGNQGWGRPGLPAPTEEGNQGWGSTMDQAVMGLVQEFARQRRGVTALPVLYGVVRLERLPPDPRLPDFVNVVAVGTDSAGMSRMNPGWRLSRYKT
jgi:hypothetical protein